MDSVTPAILNLAWQLLAGEPARPGSANISLNQAVRVCEKLRLPLIRLAGVTGYASLLSRVLVLAKRQAPGLAELRVEPDGSLSGLDEIQQSSTAAHASQDGGVILVAELLGLLFTFIGAPLTLRLLHDSWPDIPIEAMAWSTMAWSTEEKP
jgi:hypothetical protein